MTTANVAPRQAQYFAALAASLARDTGGNSGCARRGKRLKFDGVLERGRPRPHIARQRD